MGDAELVARVLDGDSRAFEALVDRYHDACFRFAWRMLGNAHDAEDVVQETFVRVYRSLARYQDRHSFRAWLYRILINRARTAGGRNRRRASRVDGDPLAVERAPQASREGAQDLRDTLQWGLDRLHPALREALLLKYGEGLEYAEMSALTGSSVPALKMRVSRGRQALKAILESEKR